MSENNGETVAPEPQRTDGGEQDQAPEAPLQFRTPVYETFEKGAETGGIETKAGCRDGE
jgi:hypothetical protein